MTVQLPLQSKRAASAEKPLMGGPVLALILQPVNSNVCVVCVCGCESVCVSAGK